LSSLSLSPFSPLWLVVANLLWVDAGLLRATARVLPDSRQLHFLVFSTLDHVLGERSARLGFARKFDASAFIWLSD